MKSLNVGAAVRRLVTSSILALFAAMITIAPAIAQNYINNPPTYVFARDYNGWSIASQASQTFVWNQGACNYTPKNPMGLSPAFFDFSGYNGASVVYFPVYINDANPALSEVVTPTSITNTGGVCGFSASPGNTHTMFQVQSGTAGLQEAVTTQAQSLPPSTVILDRTWYSQLQQLTTNGVAPTAQSVISKLTGSANVELLDVTAAPWVAYTWNGAAYVQAPASGAGTPPSSLTLVSAPTALSTAAATYGLITTATTGGTIPASSTYRFGATYVTALGGETTISTDSASTATIATGSGTATNTITVTSPAASSGAVGWRIYMSAASGASLSEILYVSSCASASTGQIVLNGVCAIGANATVTAVLTGTATIPAISTAYPALYSSPNGPLQGFQSVYGPQSSLASVAAAATGTLGVVNLPTGFLNSLGRTVRICGTGYGSTNGTTGTLTVAETLASVPGVTSITPFTAVSGTTTASAVVNFTFCTYWTVTATGASGTLEAHGTVNFNLAGTAVSTSAQDLIVAASSTVDLTKQDQIAITLKPTTTATTTTQLRQLTVELLQ